MNGWFIFLILIATIFGIFLIYFLVSYGINLCKNNDAIGIVFLFISLGILGLVIGWALLYNARNGVYLNVYEKKQKNEMKRELKEKTDIKVYYHN